MTADALGGALDGRDDRERPTVEGAGDRRTPGPWAVTEDGAHLPEFATRARGYGMLDDSLRHHGIKGGDITLATVWNHHDHHECNDNAALIAAAPDLLAALEAAIYASDGCVGHRACNHSMEPWQQARAAIAKATGA